MGPFPHDAPPAVISAENPMGTDGFAFVEYADPEPERLHALPLTKIKIDRSFVTDLHKNSNSLKIVKSLLALSRDMELDCVIEGVETLEELTALRRLGGVMVQGYFYSPPINAEQIITYLNEERPTAIGA